MNHQTSTPSMDAWIKEAKSAPNADKVGMYLFHHKTRKWYFVVGIPAIVIVEAVLLRNLILG